MTVRLSKNGKRLGRPPKDSTAKTKTFIIAHKEESSFDEVNSDDSIECSLIAIPEYSHIHSEDKKYGRYAQSAYSLNGFGKSAYVVVGYIDTDLEKHRNEQISDEQIVQRCVNYLNQDKKRKGSTKPYGNLKLYGYRMIKKFGKEVIAIELVTDSRTNQNFWGTGSR